MRVAERLRLDSYWDCVREAFGSKTVLRSIVFSNTG